MQEVTESGLLKLATPVIKMTLRLKAGLAEPTAEVHLSFVKQLQVLGGEGEKLGYGKKQLQNTKFALAAFVDQTVLTIQSPLKEQWQLNLLRNQYITREDAEMGYFERLTELLEAAPQEVDVIEVYYLCLLLGYQGRFLNDEQQQLQNVIATVADHLARLGRLQLMTLSPLGQAPDQARQRVEPSLPRWVRIGGGVWLWLLILLGMILDFLLSSDLHNAINELLRLR